MLDFIQQLTEDKVEILSGPMKTEWALCLIGKVEHEISKNDQKSNR